MYNIRELKGQLRSILNNWQRGEINEQEVHAEAEYLFEQLQETTLRPPEDDPDSITYEALSHLSALPYQLIVPGDTPIIIDFLNAQPENLAAKWAKWRVYWGGIDYKSRREALAANSYYSTDAFPGDPI
jgi:hypothetical protein